MTDMTRDEAVERLKLLREHHWQDAYTAALDLAIAALQAQGEAVGEVEYNDGMRVLVKMYDESQPAGTKLYAHPPAAKPDAVAYTGECDHIFDREYRAKPYTYSDEVRRIARWWFSEGYFYQQRHGQASKQPDAVAGLVELLAKVPLPPNAITYDKGWDLLNELQALAAAAALNPTRGTDHERD